MLGDCNCISLANKVQVAYEHRFKAGDISSDTHMHSYLSLEKQTLTTYLKPFVYVHLPFSNKKFTYLSKVHCTALTTIM